MLLDNLCMMVLADICCTDCTRHLFAICVQWAAVPWCARHRALVSRRHQVVMVLHETNIMPPVYSWHQSISAQCITILSTAMGEYLQLSWSGGVREQQWVRISSLPSSQWPTPRLASVTRPIMWSVSPRGQRGSPATSRQMANSCQDQTPWERTRITLR